MKKQEISVLAAGFLWGCTGIFTRHMEAGGLSSGGIIVLRCGVAALCFFLWALLKNPQQLKVRAKDAWCFFGSGLCSLLFFSFCYFQAIRLTGLAVAAILLYTAPAFVMLLSALLFREKITGRKLLALGLALGGCVLVCGLGGSRFLGLPGLLYGLGAGIGYALYSIFARFSLNRGYSSLCINAWASLLAAVGALLIWGPREPLSFLVSSSSELAWSVLTGIATCFLPYTCYTYGLTGMENGKASVLASIEPVVAAVWGVLLFHETLSAGGLLGILLVLGAIALLSREK